MNCCTNDNAHYHSYFPFLKLFCFSLFNKIHFFKMFFFNHIVIYHIYRSILFTLKIYYFNNLHNNSFDLLKSMAIWEFFRPVCRLGKLKKTPFTDSDVRLQPVKMLERQWLQGKCLKERTKYCHKNHHRPVVSAPLHALQEKMPSLWCLGKVKCAERSKGHVWYLLPAV